MIRYWIILSLLIFMSCTDRLIEKTSPLDGIYYVLDGWKKFEEGDYDRAHDLFSTVLLNNNTQYFGEAYVGLAWNSIYKANTIQGRSSLGAREYQRDISNQYFSLAQEYIGINEICPNDSECSDLCQNLLAGQAYNSSYQALESSRKFYDYGLDSLYWNIMLEYSDSTMIYSDKLLGNQIDECNTEYYFSHDSLVNYNTIRILRSQTQIRLGNFDNAKIELLEIPDLDCDLTIETVVECLNSLD